MDSFCGFFQDKLSMLLTQYTKKDNKELKTLIDRILYIFKISTRMTSQTKDVQICQDMYLLQAMQIVEKIIDNEESAQVE